MTVRTRARDERGLMGKVAVVWLLLLAIFVVAAIDVGSIALTRFKLGNAADTGAFRAASAYKESHDRTQAFQAAQEVIRRDVPDAKIPSNGFSIDTQTGDVTLKVVAHAWSLVAGRLSYTRPYVKVTAVGTEHPPTL